MRRKLLQALQFYSNPVLLQLQSMKKSMKSSTMNRLLSVMKKCSKWLLSRLFKKDKLLKFSFTMKKDRHLRLEWQVKSKHIRRKSNSSVSQTLRSKSYSSSVSLNYRALPYYLETSKKKIKILPLNRKKYRLVSIKAKSSIMIIRSSWTCSLDKLMIRKVQRRLLKSLIQAN